MILFQRQPIKFVFGRKKTWFAGVQTISTSRNWRMRHEIAFLNLYQKVIGGVIHDSFLMNLNKKYPKILKLHLKDLLYTLQILKMFGINEDHACHNPQVFCINPYNLMSHGKILQECKFKYILPQNLIRYGVMVRSKTISRLKFEGILDSDLNLEKTLFGCFDDLPKNEIILNNFRESYTNIVTVRMSVVEKYLHWKLGMTSDEFKLNCERNSKFKHIPICNIKKMLHIAQNVLKMSNNTIRKDVFILTMDVTNTELILSNVHTLGGLDIKSVIKKAPRILKRTYKDILLVEDILKQYNFSNELQRACLDIYSVKPSTVVQRLKHLVSLKEFPALSTFPKVLRLVYNYNSAIDRLNELREKKRVYNFHHLFNLTLYNKYIQKPGARLSLRGIRYLLKYTLLDEGYSCSSLISSLKRHKFWLLCPHTLIYDNIQLLKNNFKVDAICANCQVVLYPISNLKLILNNFLELRNGDLCQSKGGRVSLDQLYRNVNFKQLTDHQLLSLVLYELERESGFSGNGIWPHHEVK